MTASTILDDLPILSRIQHVFMTLSTYRWFYRFFGFSLLLLSQLHRSDRTSLGRLWVRDYRLVVLFMIEICTIFVCYACIGYFSRLPMLSHIQHVFMNLLTYRWFYRLFVFSLLSLSASIRSNLTIDDNRLDSKLFIDSFVLDSRFVRMLYSFHQTYWLDALCRSCSFQPMLLSDVP